MIDILRKLEVLYGDSALEIYEDINQFISDNKANVSRKWVSEKDIMLITYGDSIVKEGETPLKMLNMFLNDYTKDSLSAIHLLPMFPYTSDDGFSVLDYRLIDPKLGNWNDIAALTNKYDLMFDAVINHISKSSDWFEGFLNGDKKYKDFFIKCDDTIDYSNVVRPRALPLYYSYKSSDGPINVWATFSEDQVDINFSNPKVLMEILDILVMYAKKGARFIRFDAVGFAWKKLGTSCIHLPETHILIQVMRYVLDKCVPGTIIISETNVPHVENISYFGNGHNEAQMVYQFPLPPLTLFTFLKGDATKLMNWAKSLENTPLTKSTSYFNFLASHDGIGMRPVEDILTKEEKELMIDNTINNGGKVNYKNNPDGSKSPYELNINFQDALTHPRASKEERITKFLASQCILLSVIGVPGIYIHSLLGSRNDYEGVKESGINRRINREKLNYDKLTEELNSETQRKLILENYLKMIDIRKKQTAFSPNANQEVVYINNKVLSIIRYNKLTNQKILVLVNISNDTIVLDVDYSGIDLLNLEFVNNEIILAPFQYRWIELKEI